VRTNDQRGLIGIACDEAGTLLYQVVRFAPKDFRQRCPDGAGGWLWKLNGVRRVLYHLPEVRAAVAAHVPITYKILFNDAVAMTGGQPTDGQLTVPQLTQQMAAEGVGKIVVVTDDPPKYNHLQDFPSVNAHGATGDAWRLAAGVTIHHRDELDQIQRELREFPDVSVLIYDQTCASEKRRRRKRNEYPDPPRRVMINGLLRIGAGSRRAAGGTAGRRRTDGSRRRAPRHRSCRRPASRYSR